METPPYLIKATAEGWAADKLPEDKGPVDKVDRVDLVDKVDREHSRERWHKGQVDRVDKMDWVDREHSRRPHEAPHRCPSVR